MALRIDADVALLLAFLYPPEFPGGMRDPAELGRWFEGRGVVPPGTTVDSADLLRARHLRAALQSLFLANNGTAVDPRTAPALEAVTRAAPLTLTLDTDGIPSLVAEGAGVAAVLSRLTAVVYGAVLKGEFARFKGCRHCGMAYFDTSKNRSRVWCEMATCGSQSKAKAFRARRAAAQE